MIFQMGILASGVLLALSATLNAAVLIPASLLVALAAFVESRASMGVDATLSGAVWAAWLATVTLQAGFVLGAVLRESAARRSAAGRATPALPAQSTALHEGSGS